MTEFPFAILGWGDWLGYLRENVPPAALPLRVVGGSGFLLSPAVGRGSGPPQAGGGLPAWAGCGQAVARCQHRRAREQCPACPVKFIVHSIKGSNGQQRG